MKKYDDVLLYKIIRPIITVLFVFLFRAKIKGKKNIPIDGSVILAGNHTHILDACLLMSSTKRSIHFLAKQELWKGFKKILFSNLGLIPVNRKIKDHNCLKMAEKYLEKDKVIGIFPEGTLEKEKSKLLPFKIGAVKLAKSTDTKIIPFAIQGKYKLFSKDLIVIFGEPLIINDDLEKENERLSDVVKSLMVGEK